jgi:hypothetical protein
MKKLFWLALLLVFIPKAHAEVCTTLSSGASQSAISSALSSCGSGNTVAFSAGTYGPITSTVTIPCGVSMMGPSVSYSQTPNQTSAINGSSSNGTIWGFQTTAGCSASQTIEYLEWNGEQATNSGGFLNIVPGTTNLAVTHNYLHGVTATAPCCTGQSQTSNLITFTGPNSTVTNNVSISWNVFGTASLSDCSAIMQDASNNEINNGGFCSGIGIGNNITNVTIENNIFRFLEQGMKFYEGDGETNPLTVQFNDYNNIHRINFETQSNSGTSDPADMAIRYNSVESEYEGTPGSWGFSSANGCGNLGSSGCITNTDYNVIIGYPESPSSYMAGGVEEWGTSGTTASYNLIQGWWANSIMIAYNGDYTDNYNTMQNNYNPAAYSTCSETPNGCSSPSNGSFFNNEDSPSYTTSATGNTFAGSSSSVTSVAPTISPASGSFTGSQVVTITNPGTNRDTNTTDWCTTDGSTPTPGSGTALGYYNGGSITVISTTTVKCVGMWGSLNQPHSYTSGYGYVASAVVSATYTGGGHSAPANGTYEIENGGDSVDGGFGYFGYSGPQVQLYSTVTPPAALQQWIWNGSTLQNNGWPGHYMTDAGNGTVSELPSGYDTWTATSSGSGWLIQDNRTANFLSNSGGTLAMSSTETVWTLSATVPSLANGTYEFTINGDSIDGGFGYYDYSGPQVQLYSTVSPPAALQEWIWNGSTLQNNGWAGHYMTDAGGTVSEPTSGYDTWTATQSGSGWVIKDIRTGNYLTDSGGTLITSSTATVFTAVSQ